MSEQNRYYPALAWCIEHSVTTETKKHEARDELEIAERDAAGVHRLMKVMLRQQCMVRHCENAAIHLVAFPRVHTPSPCYQPRCKAHTPDHSKTAPLPVSPTSI